MNLEMIERKLRNFISSYLVLEKLKNDEEKYNKTLSFFKRELKLNLYITGSGKIFSKNEEGKVNIYIKRKNDTKLINIKCLMDIYKALFYTTE